MITRDRIVGAFGLTVLSIWGATMFKFHEHLEAWPLWSLALVAIVYLAMLLSSADLLLHPYPPWRDER